MQCYLSGAQSVGTTTLIKELNRQPQLKHLNIQVIDEVARSLIKQDKVDLNVFQDYQNRQEEFYQFNLKLVNRYLEMARKDRLLNDAARGIVKLYDRSGVDAINFIVTYLPHLADRMLGEMAVRELLEEYSSSNAVTLIVVDPHEDIMEHDGIRLPPQLRDLLSYTKNLRQLLSQRDIKRIDLPERDLQIRVTRVSEFLLAQPKE